MAKLPGLQSGADSAFEQGDFQSAYDLYTQYINLANANSANVSDDINAKLAMASAHINKFDEADAILGKLLKNPANAHLILDYAQLLQAEGQTEKELELWNTYSFDDAKINKRKTERLILLNSESENFEAAIKAYENKGDVELSKESGLAYIKALSASDQNTKALKASSALIKAHPDYVEVKQWKAKYLYERADKRYKYEMAKYNKNKNATTYAYLRRDLKKISTDFRNARDLFEQLHKQNPEEKMYIKYLKNCYLRLEQKSKAAQMDKLLK